MQYEDEEPHMGAVAPRSPGWLPVTPQDATILPGPVRSRRSLQVMLPGSPPQANTPVPQTFPAWLLPHPALLPTRRSPMSPGL